MKKSIIEYKGVQHIVEVPNEIALVSAIVDDYATREITDSKTFTLCYEYIGNYYQQVGRELFNNQELFFDAFYQHDEEMVKDGILDYAVLC